MNQNSCYATPMSSKPFLSNSKGRFHDFVRPSGTSPYKGSPKSEDFDFIPLSYSSPVTYTNGGNWKAYNRKKLSLSNPNLNSSFSPYRMSSSNGNSSFSPYNNMDRPRSYSSNRNRRGKNVLGNMRNSDDINLYYHPSMLEDPWAELEQKLQNRTPDRNCSRGGKHAREKSTLNSSTVDSLVSVSDSDEGAYSQGTESSSLSSDGLS